MEILSKIDTLTDDFLGQFNLDAMRRKRDFETIVYFDNSVVRSMIQGIAGIETGLKIDREKFRSPQLLVQSLAYFGLIKNIRVLPPHQDELLDFLSQRHLLPQNHQVRSEALINDLLFIADLINIDELKKYISNNDINTYLQTFKHRSVELYKINYLLKDLRWNERLRRLITFKKDSPVVIDETTDGFEEAINSSTFKLLVEIFNDERSKKTKNNFRDALSLTLIKIMVDDWKEGKGPLPIFYTSTKIIRRLQNRPIAREFTVSLTIGKKEVQLNVLRDSYFFILDVLFSEGGKEKLPKEIFDKFDDLQKRFEKAALQEAYTRTNLESELENIIFKDHFFLEFWYSRMQKENLDSTIQDLVSYDFLKTGRDMPNLIKEEQKQVVEKLSKSLTKLNLIERIWLTVDKLVQEVPAIFSDKRDVNVFTDLGLTRFSLDEFNEIQELVDTIRQAEDNDDHDFFAARNALIGYVLNGVVERNYIELLIAVSVFWVFNKFLLVIQILDMLEGDYGGEYRLALLHAASIYPAEYKDKGEVEKILAPFIESLNTDYSLWLGTGFIHYHIWKGTSGKRTIPEENPDASPHDFHILSAIELTQKAYECLRSLREKNDTPLYGRHYYYALNNLLYFKVRIEPADQLPVWETLAEELRNSRDAHKSYWQARFDHTLAVFEYRMYMLYKEKGQPVKAYLDDAMDYIKSALMGIAIHKDDYRDLKQKIVKLLAKDFPPRFDVD